jgi:hypothetical protein
MKHNVEMIVSPVPDGRHAAWKNVAKKHIVNLHEAADVKPFRWGSPQFIREMVGQWKAQGFDGAESYGLVSWRWPYSLDKLEPQQKGFWPEGKKLVTFERDAIWQEALGRYLWKVDRPRDEEVAYWTARLAERFGNARAGAGMLRWYDTTGPVLPGLQNLTHVANMNWFPTAVGKEQTVDAILNPLDPANNKGGPYHVQPVDSFFFERYRKKYGAPPPAGRVPMPVDAYADAQAEGRAIAGVMTPDKVAGLLVELAEEGVRIAESNRQAATRNQDEAARFVTDSQALVLVAKAWRQKVLAAIAKRCFQKTGDEKYARALLDHVRKSIDVYEELVALTDQTYLNATDITMEPNWHEGLKAFRADLPAQEAFLKAAKAGGPRASPDADQAARRMVEYFESMQRPKPLEVRRGDDWQKRREAVRRRLLRDIGLDPLPERVPLDPHSSAPLDRPWCTIRKVAYQLWPGVYSRGLLYLPKTLAGKPAPAMLCPHGHYADGYADAGEQARALMFAKLGYVAFATAQEHHEDLLRGVSCQTFMVWNNMRALDFLQSLPEVDGRRIGVCGLSGGGLQSQMLVATDPRIKAATIAGMTCRFREILYPHTAQCGCNHWPGATACTDGPEISVLGFPAAVQYLTMNDWTAHFAADDFPAIRAIYRENGFPDRTECVYWPTGHVFDRPKRERAYWWMEKWVRGDRQAAVPSEPDTLPTVEPKVLLEWKVDVPGERSFEDYFRETFRRENPDLGSSDAWNAYRGRMTEALRQLLGEARALPPEEKSASRQVKPAWAEGRGVRVEQFLAASEDRIAIPGIILYPPPEKTPASVEVCLSAAGRSAVEKDPSRYLQAAQRGAVVAVPDLRFSGDYALPRLAGRIGPKLLQYPMAFPIPLAAQPQDQLAQLARAWDRDGIAWGRPIPGMMVTDLRRVLDFLETDRRVSMTSVQVTTKDSPSLALAGLLAACLDRRIAAIDADFAGRCFEQPGSWPTSQQSLPMVSGILCYGDVVQWAALLADRRVTLRRVPRADAARRWLEGVFEIAGPGRRVTIE